MSTSTPFVHLATSTTNSFNGQLSLTPSSSSSSAISAKDLLSSMSAHSKSIRFTPSPTDPHCRSPTVPSSSRRGSDVESGYDWAYAVFTKRRQTRRTSHILFAVIISSGLIYMLIDNFLLADWVSTRSRYRPTYLRGQDQELVNVPDRPDTALSASKWLGSGIVRIPNDEGHVLVPNPSALPTYDLLRPKQRLPSPLLVSYYSTGLIPFESLSPSPNLTIDVVYTFVNASSPILQEAKTMRAEDESLGKLEGSSRHWRDNGELRGAVRSAAEFLAEGLRRVHVISADFELDSVSPEGDLAVDEDDEEGSEEVDVRDVGDSKWRAGQVPWWLNTSAEDVGVQWHFHSEIFRLPTDQGQIDSRIRSEWKDETSWRREAMPNFNSFQIESKIGWINGLSENFVVSNDDMFFLRDLSATDFHHPLLGPVFRLAPDPGLRVSPVLRPELFSDPGEWGALQHANYLLSNRFYSKNRMYMSHVPKSMSLSLSHEASIMFADALALSATRGFRESKRGHGDVHYNWLVTHLHIERWREALLWTWAVAKLGGQDGMWSDLEKGKLKEALGFGAVSPEDLRENIVIVSNPRSTMVDMDEIMEKTEWQFPQGSNYLFSSMDGHLPHTPSNDDNLPPRSCVFSLRKCLPSNFFTDPNPISAIDMFINFAFVSPECGDCLIMALTNASGQRGLSAFLPDANVTFEPEVRDRGEWEREEPMLPLVPDWKEGNFSLAAVIRPGQDIWEGEKGRSSNKVNLREYCVKLLSRYTYSVATSPTHFALSRSPFELTRILEEFTPLRNLAMGCLNDDQPDGADSGRSAQILGDWMKDHFGGWEAGWEKKDWPWTLIEPVPEEVEVSVPGPIVGEEMEKLLDKLRLHAAEKR